MSVNETKKQEYGVLEWKVPQREREREFVGAAAQKRIWIRRGRGGTEKRKEKKKR